MNPGRFDIGLNIKVGKKYKLPGYTRASRSFAQGTQASVLSFSSRPLFVV